MRHFLTLNDLTYNELQSILQRACSLRQQYRTKTHQATLSKFILGMIFEKPSTRTRVAFEAGMLQLGGQAIYLGPTGTQIDRGESIEDTARILSRLVDCIVIRTFEHERVEKFAAHAKVPVINGLSDRFHPCQLLADLLTYQELKGAIADKKVVWFGDGNNMCHSYMHAAKLCHFHLTVSTPQDYGPDPHILAATADFVTYEPDPKQAAQAADLVVTDVWVSMGQESQQAQRRAIFAPYQVNADLMQYVKKDALFMHCLPAHRGEEVSAEIFEGPRSVVWDEAENRLHSQKALLEFLLLQQ